MESEIILITGCSSGLGRKLCILLKEKGYRVVATARAMSKLNQVPADLKLELDVTDAKSIENAIGTIIRQYGRIDVLVNNAGYSIRTAIEEIELEEMSKMFDVNVYGIIRMIQAVAPYMRGQNSGKIINIGSISGKLTGYINGAYCASKHAVEAISDAARLELQSFGIQVSVLEPGAINTEFFKTLSVNSDEKMKNNTSAYAELYQKDLNYRKKQKRADAGKAAEDIYKKLKSNKLKARYLIAVPKILKLLIILPDSIREKIMFLLTS
ncbi:MAG: short-chain dehydrogenase/reductase [Lacrimispora sp.]|nr:short-chain dehydrogenase/reductase [Lacrimispora sp.]